MEEWYKPTSTLRVVLGIVFIIAAFVFMIYYFNFIPFSTSNMLTVWLGAIVTCFLFLLGFYVGLDISTKKVLVAALVLSIWSMGLLILPVPEGYGEAVYGCWAVLLMIIMILFAKYQEAKKKKDEK